MCLNHPLPSHVAELREPSGRDERGANLRLRPFVEIRVLAIERLRDHKAHDRVAEELERLVVAHPAGYVLVRARAVRERVLEERGIAEAVADARLERRNLTRWVRSVRTALEVHPPFSLALDYDVESRRHISVPAADLR